MMIGNTLAVQRSARLNVINPGIPAFLIFHKSALSTGFYHSMKPDCRNLYTNETFPQFAKTSPILTNVHRLKMSATNIIR